MKQNGHTTKLLLAGLALLTLLGGGVSQAASITLDWVDSGFWRNGDIHVSQQKNYFAGRISSRQIYNNFFVFDLSGVSATIVSATLRLTSPVNSFFSRLTSSVDYDLFDVSTPITELTTTKLLSGHRGIFSDLGTGLSYGSTPQSAANNATLVDIALNGNALAALNGANGLFALGGSIRGGLDGQLVFANSGLPTHTRQLILETSQPVGRRVGNPVPEPGTIFLLGSGLIGLAAWRFKKQG